jgi:pimeloyl-ACP methyl ester carboxylesterase/V8-like Glu-specific endopeptidase
MANRVGTHQQRLGKHLKDLLSRTPEAAGASAPAVGMEEAMPVGAPRARVHRHEDVERRADELIAGHTGRPEAHMVEAIILPDLRPVIDVVDGTFPDPGRFFPELAADPAHVKEALPSIGRLNVLGIPGVPYVGTGFLVGDGVLMTNRHVAEIFTSGLGKAARLRFLPGITPSVDLKAELGREDAAILRVEKTLLIHPYWDMALLQVKGAEKLRLLSLAVREPAKAAAPVAVVGYPAFDPRNDRDVQMNTFRGVFGVKRLQPGYGKGMLETSSYGHTVVAFAHDCSTLGGNSGSCVLEVATGRVLGLHFGGVYLDSNYAVPAWELARDARVVDAGVRFAGACPKGTPSWAGAWSGLERPAAAQAVPRPATEGSPIDWYERASPDDLRRAWQRDPEGLSARLERAVGPVDARAVRSRLTEGRAERLFPRRVDPDAREVLWLHGIMGAHLDSADGRAWLDVERILLGDLAGRLALGSDGVSDAWHGPPAWPGPHLKLKYQRAADAWRDEGLVVHGFSYDWRKPVEVEAERLHAFVETLARERPGKKLLLVAHSMGGLVSAAWAAAHPEWKERIDRAVLLGSPLRGSYAPFEAIHGTYPVFRKLAQASLRNSLEQLQGMARTLSGLVDMLPDPAVFADAAAIYAGDAWRTTYAPEAGSLARSRALKAKLASSPLLERAVALVSVAHGTVSSVEDALAGRRAGPGDGTVPIASAAPPGLPAYVVNREHSDLPRDPLAIAAVLRMARGGEPGLPTLSDEQRRAPVAKAEAVVAELAAYDQLRGEEVSRRVAAEAVEGADLDWILSTGFGVPDREEGAPGETGGKALSVASGTEAVQANGEGPAFREFQLGGPFGVGDPVHETITRVALDGAGYPAAGRDQIVRGVFWNDDPEALLFDDDPQRPLSKSTGFLFALKFKRFELFVSKQRAIRPADGLLARSHFGDLQYVHAMASTPDEATSRTRQRMLGWAEFCWSVALGDVPAAAGRDRWGSQAGLFPAGVKGPGTVGELFGKVDGSIAPLRALGSLCHLVEDSFAGGHVERVAVDATRRGAIRRFFCYTNQDHAAHAAGDSWHGGGTDDQKIDLLPGARDAALAVKRLAELYMARAEWDEVKAWLAGEVWALAASPVERVAARRGGGARKKGPLARPAARRVRTGASKRAPARKRT